MEFRLYNKVNCSFFDLIGHKEPDQTKSLGYLLAKSKIAMEAFLSLLCDRKLCDRKSKKQLCSYKWIVDCEERNDEKKRADIIVRFYDEYIPVQAFLIEAKSATIFSITNSENAASQIDRYKDLLKEFDNKTWLITLTNVRKEGGKNKNITQITWSILIDTLYKSKSQDELISDFINYFNSIQGAMNFYDKEVMSIPYGQSETAVKASKLYECPVAEKRNYAKRANSKPLYITFREGGNKQGKMTKLFKVQDIIVLNFYDNPTIEKIEELKKYADFKTRIEAYKNNLRKPIDNGDKFVFILDDDNSFDLPKPVVFDKSYGLNGNPRNHVFLSLKDMLAGPVIDGQVVLNPKNQ